jgi:hypothetical protein
MRCEDAPAVYEASCEPANVAVANDIGGIVRANASAVTRKLATLRGDMSSVMVRIVSLGECRIEPS